MSIDSSTTLRTTETHRSFIDDVLVEYEEVCKACGGTYRRKMFFVEGPRRMLINERTPCLCSDEEPTIGDVLKQELGFKLLRILGKRSMFHMDSTRHMKLSTYKAETPSQKEALKYIANWTPEKGSITIAGLPGRGKTHLGMAAARKAIGEGAAVAAVRVVDIANFFRRSEMKGDDTGAELEDALKTVDVLLLDDLGAQRKTDYVTEKLYDIIDSRYGRLATIITTRLPRSEMSKSLSDYVASRVYGADKVLIIEGKDMRLNKTEAGDAGWEDIGEEVFTLEGA